MLASSKNGRNFANEFIDILITRQPRLKVEAEPL